MTSAGVLILAGTPIGDVSYASLALRQALQTADVIAAEDTRRFRDLQQRLQLTVNAEVVSFFEGNEAQRTPELVEKMLAGLTVVQVTDAGMPSVSDPGFRLVDACLQAGIKVTAVPGPSAVLTALALSGLPVNRFCFEGFPPRNAGPRKRLLTELAQERRTMVFFEAPHRLAEFLTDAAEIMGADRKAAVCREMTKTYEEVKRGTLNELASWAAQGVRGEISVVIAGFSGHQITWEAAVEQVQTLQNDGVRLKTAATQVAVASGFTSKALYQAVLDSRKVQ